MGASKQIVAVDDDPIIRSLIEQSLPRPEFEVHAFADGRDALMRLHEIRPDLIISDMLMPDMDGRTFFQVVKRSAQLREVPFIFLSGVQATDEIVATLEDGADDFVSKPFSGLKLQAKVRALLRLAGRGAAPVEERRHDQLAGSLGRDGTLPLVKFCEDIRLSGRLSIVAPGVERWAEFLGGELVRAGGTPEEPSEEPFDLLLAMTQGVYRIEQRRLDPSKLKFAPDARPDAGTLEAGSDEDDLEFGEGPAPGPARLPSGRLAKVGVRGQDVEIQTEAENRPNFTVTTILTRAGQVIRKIESAWPHPLQRKSDEEAARIQAERQHERVVATVRELGHEGATAAAARAPDAAAASVDGALLAWAVSFVAEQARDMLGSVMTTTLLRRTYTRLVRERDVLKAFRIAADGRVSVDAARALLPEAAVAAAAAWVTALLAESGAMIARAGKIKVRQATRMMEADLEKVGFYQALGEAGGG